MLLKSSRLSVHLEILRTLGLFLHLGYFTKIIKDFKVKICVPRTLLELQYNRLILAKQSIKYQSKDKMLIMLII